MPDFIIADIATHLAASKNLSYRESITRMYLTLACFLQENGLTHRPLLPQNQLLDPAFKIMRSELTDEGFEFIKCALHKWVKGVTAGKWAATDAELLIKTLEKLRQSKPNK